MFLTPRMVPATAHEPHEVSDAGELLAHLVAQHDYSVEQLSGGTRSFLTTLHLRAHHRMTDEAAGSTALLPLDRDLVHRSPLAAPRC